MRTRLNVILLSILSILLIHGTGCTDTGRYAVSGKLSTLGVGGEFTTAIASDINVRFGINGLDADLDDKDVENVDYDLDLELRSFSALVDWYIFDDAFRLSGGIISMDNKLKMDATPSESIEIGDVYFTPSEVGTLHARVEDDEVAPYLGIGWGNPIAGNRRWGFTCDLGIAFIDSPDVTLTATGGTQPPGFEEELAKEREDLKDVFDDFKVYPIIAVSLFFRF